MPGGWAEEREDGQIIFRVRGCEHVQVIDEVETPPVGISSDVTVGLAVDTAAFTVPYPFFKAAAGTFFTLLCGAVNRSAVTGNGKAHEINEAILVGFQEKKIFEYLEKAQARFHILWRCLFKFFEKILGGELFDRRGLLPFFLWLLWFFLWRMNFGREVGIIRKPKAGLEVVKSLIKGAKRRIFQAVCHPPF